MEGFGGSRFNGVNAVLRKQRTSNSRRPRTDMSLVLESPNVSPSSSTTPSSDNTNKRSPIEDAGFVTSSRKKEFNVSSANQRTSSLNKIEAGDASKKNRRDDKKYGNLEEFYVDGSSRDGQHGVTNYSVRSGEGYNVGQSTSGPNGSSESKLKKVKLKVGGVTRTIHATPDENGGPSAKPSHSPEVTRHRKKLILQDDSDDDHTSDIVRKSKRVPKRRVLDGDDDEDDEIRYLDRLKSSKSVADHNVGRGFDEDENAKKRKISKLPKSKRSTYEVDEDYGSSRSAAKVDFAEEVVDARMEPLTTRQRAIQSGKGADAGGSFIEFPDGLPPVPSRKKKEKLSEVEQQAKKAEAAQRRRLQVEKQAKELEAEAIRKILGQDSSRKKKEEKERKERDEKAQRKAAESLVLASNTVRWVMGPTGTIVTFAEDVDLSRIFGSKTTSYPPPREKCAGPSCTNAYKYRDSKLNLPLCSLQCYQAVQKRGPTVSTC